MKGSPIRLLCEMSFRMSMCLHTGNSSAIKIATETKFIKVFMALIFLELWVLLHFLHTIGLTSQRRIAQNFRVSSASLMDLGCFTRSSKTKNLCRPKLIFAFCKRPFPTLSLSMYIQLRNFILKLSVSGGKRVSVTYREGYEPYPFKNKILSPLPDKFECSWNRISSAKT